MATQPITVRGGTTFNALPPTQPTLQVPPNGWSLDGLFFDAWLFMYQSESIEVTRHPVETGANITDHAYVNPITFSFEIGITNAKSQAQQGSFPAAPTRAINAYQALSNRLRNRQVMTLICKYGTYDNILIKDIVAQDDHRTQETGRFTVNLIEILRADTRRAEVNSFPQIVNTTNRGQINPGPLRSTLNRIFGAL